MQRGRGVAIAGTLSGLSLLLIGAVLSFSLLGTAPAPRAAAAATVSRDGVSAAMLPPLDRRAPAETAPAASAAPEASPPLAVGNQPAATPEPSPARDLVFDDYFVHVPPGLTGPAPVLVALHGMGGSGRGMCDAVRAWADREGWVLVGPTFAYGDWTNPAQVATEEPRFIGRLAEILDALPAAIGHTVQPRAALYGFSRGAQLAGRFTLLHPHRVRGAVVMAAGSYTLPLREMTIGDNPHTLAYPLGIADVQQRFGRDANLDGLRQVPFWIGVGADDDDPRAVPAQWTPYIGDDRVERAQRYGEILRSLNVAAQVHEFAGVGHTISELEQDQALAWIRSLP